MACFDETMDKCFADEETSKFSSAPATNEQPPSQTACFDCSICLDFAVDPVVTLCGHLYCWPCIYRWMQADTTSHQQCPICKAPVSENALVPLYGRGALATNPKGSNKSLDIPKRPNVLSDVIASMIDEQHSPSMNDDDYSDTQGQQFHRRHQYDPYPASQWGASVFSSTAGGVLGGLAVAIHPLMSRNNYLMRPYRLETNGSSPRERRQEMLVEESLHQIWIFLFCGAVLCLLFF